MSSNENLEVSSHAIADEKQCDVVKATDTDNDNENDNQSQVILSDTNTQSSTVHGVDDANECSELLSAPNKTDRTDCDDDDDDVVAAAATLVANPCSPHGSDTHEKSTGDDTSTATTTTTTTTANHSTNIDRKNDENESSEVVEPTVTGKKRKREKTRWGPPPRKKRWGAKQAQSQPQQANTTALIQNLLQLSSQKQQNAAMANAMVGNAWNENQTKIFLLKNQLQDVSTRLIAPGAFAVLESQQQQQPDGDKDGTPAAAERSPSPEPVYDQKTGVRINTREYRLKEKLQQQRNAIIGELLRLDATYQAPPDYKAPKLTHKIMMPVDEFPDYNFFGLIVGPRGHTQKEMQKETGCKIAVRGQGACVDKPNRLVHPDDDEALHVHITAPNQESLERATRMIEQLLDEVKTGGGQHKAKQLRELATINGTLRIESRCRVCGGAHPIYSCPERTGEQWTPADIQCAICGELTHVTADCKHYKRGKPLHLQPHLSMYGGGVRPSIDAEYDAFMSELIGDGGSTSSRPIAAITAPPTAHRVSLQQQQQQQKSHSQSQPTVTTITITNTTNTTATRTAAAAGGATDGEYHNVAPPSQSGALPPKEYEVTTKTTTNGEDVDHHSDTVTTNTNTEENSNGVRQVTVPTPTPTSIAPVMPAMNMAMPPMMNPAANPYAMSMMNPAAAAAMMAAPMYPGLMRPTYPFPMNPYAMSAMPMAMPPPPTYPYYGNPYFATQHNPYSTSNVPK